MAKRQAAESSMHGICCFYAPCQLTGLHNQVLPEFPSYLLQYGNMDLLFTLLIFSAKDRSAPKTPEQMATMRISHCGLQVFTGSLDMPERGLQLSTLHPTRCKRLWGFLQTKHHSAEWVNTADNHTG